MEAKETNRKRKLELDWDKLFSRRSGNEEPPPPLVVIKTVPQPPPRKSDAMGGGDDTSKEDFFDHLTDKELEVTIQRHQGTLKRVDSKLPDKGQKTRDLLVRLDEERKRRTLSRAKMDVDKCEKPARSQSSDLVGSSNIFGQQSKSHQALLQSTFGASFHKKMEENRDCRIVNTFDKDLSILNHCEHRKNRCNGEFSLMERLKNGVSPKRMKSQHDRKPSFGNQKDRTASVYFLRDHDPENDFPSFAKKNASQVLPSNDSRCRKGQTIVLVDVEESQPVNTTEHVVELPNCKKDARIYYPSRDDLESVEICFTDIYSLSPETFLTSQIMNFYIRFLQQQASSTNRAICDYHFFNTYFYQKLKEALSYKGSDKDSFFIKFRRWWKGVNIFKKAYVLIPINEDLHWSLVIISIPDKGDESGPIILHLDSLGLHSSRFVFENIKSFMRREWNYLNQESAPSNLPIRDEAWKNIPHRIDEKTIPVPQQKNDYDCGLFVLFFVERFIEEAPQRLKTKDLAMFSTQWFKPEEASGLRVKIRNLLIEQFRSASEDICD